MVELLVRGPIRRRVADVVKVRPAHRNVKRRRSVSADCQAILRRSLAIGSSHPAEPVSPAAISIVMP